MRKKIIGILIILFGLCCINIVNAENIDGDRYSANKAYCGSKLHITTCNSKICNFDRVDDISKSGSIFRNDLRIEQNVATSDCKNMSYYRVSFTPNGNININCGGLFSKQEDAACVGYFLDEKTISLKKYLGDLNETKDSSGRILYGWTSTLIDNVPQCTSDTIIDKSSTEFNLNGNADYYGCYERIINATRYSVADCGNDYSPVGIYITSCFLQNDNGEENEYCYYKGSDGNWYTIASADLIQEESSAIAYCEEKSTVKYDKNMYVKYGASASMSFECGSKVKVTTCKGNLCTFTKLNGKSVGEQTINLEYLTDSESDAQSTCPLTSEEEVEETQSDEKICTGNDIQKSVKGTYSFDVCYNKSFSDSKVQEMINDELISCGYKYKLNATKTYANSDATCGGGACLRNYTVTCSPVSNVSPKLSVTSGIVGSNGKGIITVKATATDGNITSYYASENHETPTSSSGAKWINVKSNEFTIESTPGILYIWVKDSNGNISNAISGAVIDTVNTNTTIKTLQLYDDNGNLQAPSSVSYNTNYMESSNYVRLSNKLNNDSKLADAFNPFDTEYTLEVDSPTVTVYATLTSTDSKFVEGYEPRTVNLKYGTNTVLIKIENNEGKIRTYTILVTRKDNRTSDNTLSELAVSVGKINFNSNVTNYKITIPKETTEVAITASISSDKASYLSDYEPGVVNIIDDTTVKLIKVKSQTGSTRTYVLTFVKEGTDVIEKDSLKLFSLGIEGVYIPFEETISNYSVSVDYETDIINLNASLKDSDSSILIRAKSFGESEFSSRSSKGIPLSVGDNYIEIIVTDKDKDTSYYRITIIRKEYGLGISDDKTLNDLKVLGHNIDFDPTKKDYTVKIKTEKSLVITAVPESNRAEVFIIGNDELTGFSTVRIKVVAENGEYETYSIDIKKDAFNKTIEIAAVIAGAVIILLSSCILIIKKKRKSNADYYKE